MKYRELKELIAINTGVDEETIEMVLEEFRSIVIGRLANLEKVKVAGLGTFTMREKRDSKGRVIKLSPRLIFFADIRAELERNAIKED